MKFTSNTKPLQDALNLAVVKSNVSKFYKKSGLAKVSADRHNLQINFEAAYVTSEIKIKGSGDEDTTQSRYVDNLLLHDLVSTFESDLTQIEFVDGGLILYSGKSKFNLPQILEETEMDLEKPHQVDPSYPVIDLNKPNWQFIKDHQMFAISMSFIHPVYTRLWVSDKNDVIVGDFDNSLFTHSTKSVLNTTCLLSDTVINLLTSVPEDTKLMKLDQSYLISVATDAYSYLAEVKLQSESDEGVGDYNADIILGTFSVPETDIVKVARAPMLKLLGQSELLAKDANKEVNMSVKGTAIEISDDNVHGSFAATEPATATYDVVFKMTDLKSILSNLDEDVIMMAPTMRDEETGVVGGVVFSTSNMEAVIASVGSDEE